MRTARFQSSNPPWCRPPLDVDPHNADPLPPDHVTSDAYREASLPWTHITLPQNFVYGR